MHNQPPRTAAGTPRWRRQAALAKLLARECCTDSRPLEALAHDVHYAPSHLRALFREATGESLMRSLRRRRLDAAAARLVVEHASVMDLAAAAGYTSGEAFHHAFKARFGRSPSAFAASPAPAATDPRAIGIGVALAGYFARIDQDGAHG